MYYAHSKSTLEKSEWQLLKDHLTNVSNIAAGFATDFHAGELAYTGGLLHDIGKYSRDFQMRIRGANIRVDHSTAGAREAELRYPRYFSIILEYIITGHHGGLLNYGSNESGLLERLKKQHLPEYTAFKEELKVPDLQSFKPHLKPFPGRIGFAISFYTRMLYSCLVDADSLDSEQFENPDKSLLRSQYDSMGVLSLRFDEFMKEKISGAANSEINQYRRLIYEQCLDKADHPPQMFSLTVPTGGGKTLSSMAFALEHLKKYDLKRIFYVIPYTSIIEQNAKVFRDIFGSKNVLEHHSNFDPKTIDIEEMDEMESLKLSSENWDMPIIITTNVQFFESLFSNRRSRCRKLHNLAQSVIILDEAQMLPTGYLKPCLAALSELVRNYGSTVVICTATQPNLDGLLDKSVRPLEIITSPEQLYETFKRVRVTEIGRLGDTELSERLKMHRQVLCIVNTRNHAKKLFDSIKETGNCFHLSARMCPVHRRKKIVEIRKVLNTGNDCRIISTQLIEAGVDIDLPTVYRAMAGIDSIAQAAGRCNREGKEPFGDLYVFKSMEPYGGATSWQNLTAEVGEMVFGKESDPLSLSTVSAYFEQLFKYKGGGGLDEKRILLAFEERSNDLAFPFEDVGNIFNIIDGGTRDLIVPYDGKAESVIQELRKTESPWSYVRELQGYHVSVYPNEFMELERLNAIDLVGDRFYVLKSRDYYSDETGLISSTEIGTDGSLLIV